MRKNTFFFTLLSLLPAAGALSQAETKPVQSDNSLLYLMVAVAFVLAFVIWQLGQVLLTLGRQVLERSKNNGSALPLVITFLLMSLPSLLSAQETTAAVTTAPAASTEVWIMAVTIAVELLVISFIMFGISRLQKELLPPTTKKQFAFSHWWKKLDSKLFTRAVAVEKEQDIVLDHDYDGIRELDNSLPPWWKYGFYFTILVAVGYMLHFHVFATGKNPEQEYQAEVARAQVEMEEYNAKNKDKVDENNLQMPDEAGITLGKEIFQSACWTCHGKLGEGGAGPNLTDEFWLHKGSLKDIYQSIKIGYPEKGMQGWEKNYSAKQINNIAGYIKTLQNTNPPNAKPAQGDKYAEVAASEVTTALK